MLSQTGLKYSTPIVILNATIVILGMMVRVFGGPEMSLITVYQFMIITFGYCAYSISILNQMIAVDNKTTADLMKIVNKAQFEK